MADSTAGQQRGRPFPKGTTGNPRGRPKGTRHKATLAAEVLLDGEAEALTRRCVELALGGDMTAMRLCMDRLLPPRRERPVSFRLPPIQTADDAVTAAAALVNAVASGMLTPGEAADLAKLVQAYTDALEASEVERRLAELEAQAAEGRGR
jgi:Family of unknown function (DUF5681)